MKKKHPSIFIIGNRLKESRKERSMTLKVLEEKTGISSCRLSSYERGKRIPDVNTLLIIVDSLGVSLDYLMNRSDKMYQKNSFFGAHKLPNNEHFQIQVLVNMLEEKYERRV